MADKLILKKYGNRRLYDTERSTYVTLDDISRAIREGREIEVMDARTKEDVTAFILTQVLLEHSKKKNIMLPVPLLHLLIRYGDNVLSDFFHNYLQQVLKNYLSYKTFADEQFKHWLDTGLDLSQMTKPPITELTPLKPFIDLFSGKKKKNK